MNYTKGPWRVEREADTKSTGFMVMAADDSEYADVGDQRIVASYLTRGDADLIAAAPDLLEACKTALEDIDLIDVELQRECLLDAPMRILREAIAKAEGRP